MKKCIVSLILALVVIISSTAFLPSAAVGYTLPQSVRVGLYFKGHPSGSAPVSSIKVSSEGGVRLRLDYGGSAIDLGPVFDSYVVCSKVSGQYHIEMGGSFRTFEAAQELQMRLADAGIDTVAAYNGDWRLWSGSYADSSEASAAMTAMDSGDISKRIISPSANRIACSSNGQTVFYFDVSGAGLKVVPAGSGYLTLNDTAARTYRGVIEIRRYSASDMTVVNELPLDQYLYGVVPNEIDRGSGAEALKAQAVAARTYVARSMGSYPSYGFDVSDTVYDQVYKGVNFDTKECCDAVNATAGRLIWYGDELVDAYYFSCANGFTEDSVNVMNITKPYLKSVDSTFESSGTYLYSWTVSFSASGLTKQLISKGFSIGNVTGIRVNSFSQAGRVTSLTLIGSNGSKTVTNSNCRTILDLYSQQYTIEIGNGDGTATVYYPISAESEGSVTPSTAVATAADANRVFLRSVTYANLRKAMEGHLTDPEGHNLILGAAGFEGVTGKYITDCVGEPSGTPEPTEDTFFKTALPYTGGVGTKTVSSILGAGEVRISGKGWGHAVGMSQEGATALARLGYSYVEILEHYYSGATVK